MLRTGRLPYHARRLSRLVAELDNFTVATKAIPASSYRRDFNSLIDRVFVLRDVNVR